MKWLAIPEDDATPHTPFHIVIQGEFETANPHLARRANLLSPGQFDRPVREEEVVASLAPTSPFSLYLNQSFTHVESSSSDCGQTKSRRVSGGLFAECEVVVS
jgi:hypothetical protein